MSMYILVEYITGRDDELRPIGVGSDYRQCIGGGETLTKPCLRRPTASTQRNPMYYISHRLAVFALFP